MQAIIQSKTATLQSLEIAYAKLSTQNTSKTASGTMKVERNGRVRFPFFLSFLNVQFAGRGLGGNLVCVEANKYFDTAEVWLGGHWHLLCYAEFLSTY